LDPSTALIVFREVLEAALVVGIVMAGSKGVPGRGLWVGGGILAGVLGACAVAAFAGAIQNAAAGVGQELMNAGILFVAGPCWAGTASGWGGTAARSRSMCRQ
jgi:high-affinity iron transporter